MTQPRLAPSAALAALLVASLSGCSLLQPPSYQSAVDDCLAAEVEEADGDEGRADLMESLYEGTFSVAGDGDSLEIDTINSLGATLMGASIQCVLGELDAPSGMWSRMGQATALSGVQTEEWDGHTATWTFHPDNGLSIVISRD